MQKGRHTGVLGLVRDLYSTCAKVVASEGRIWESGCTAHSWEDAFWW